MTGRRLSSRGSSLLVACGLASLIIWLAIAPEPPLFSQWESLAVYGTYGAQDGRGFGRIASFGNIGGLGYDPVELSRVLLGLLNLPPTLWSIRLPSLLFSVASLIILWVLGSRLFGSRTSLAVTAVVVTAPMFVFYSSELIVVASSFFALALFLERLDFLARNGRSGLAWLTLTLSLAFALTLYGPVRIICVSTLILSLLWFALFPRRQRFTTRLRLVLPLALSFPAALLLLTIVNPFNFRMLGPQLLFPRLAESALVNGSEIGLAEVLSINGRIVFEILTGLGAAYTSSFIEATQIQGRFPLSSLGFALVSLAGATLATISIFRSSPLHKTRNLGILVLLIISVLPMMTSSVFYTSENGREILLATLTDYRLVFALVPLGFLFGVAMESILKQQRLGPALQVAVTAMIVIQHTWIVVQQHQDFSDRMASTEPNLSFPEKYTQWLDGYALTDRNIGWASHFEQQVDLRNWAMEVASLPPDGNSIVFTPLSCFAENPLKPRSLGEIPGRASTQVWASAYLADENPELNPGFVFVPMTSGEQESLAGKQALWSAKIEPDSSGRMEYVDADVASARIVTLNGSPPDLILAFTELELAIAEKAFGEKGSLVDVTWGRDCV